MRLLIVAALGIVSCQPSQNIPVGQSRFLYNSDGSNIFLKGPAPLSVQDVWDAVDEVAGTQATTFLISPNAGQNMFYPGRIAPMFGENDYEKITAPDSPWSKFIQNWAVNLRNFVEKGYDPIGLVVERGASERA